MFPKHARYRTHGIEVALPERLQNALWAIVDMDLFDGKELDPMQIFELSVGRLARLPVQQVRQHQDPPRGSRLHIFPRIQETVSDLTVWIIDDGTYCTMLLPEEY